MRNSAIALALASILVLSSGVASAEALWDQSALDTNSGLFNSVSGSPPFGTTVYVLCDVNVDNMWVVDEIVQVYGAVDQSWGAGIFEGYVNVIPKTAALPGAGDDPAMGLQVPMTGTVEPGPIDPITVVRASGLGIMLEPGEYWIGITPVAPAGMFGPEGQMGTTTSYGVPSARFNAVVGSWENSNVEANILINGAIAVPAGSSSFGQVKALFN